MSGPGTRVSDVLQRAQYPCACRHHRRVQTHPRFRSSPLHTPETAAPWFATTARAASPETNFTAQISNRPIQTP